MQTDPLVTSEIDDTYGESFWIRIAKSTLLTWSFFISLGLLVFETTANPLLGAVIVCLQFGLQDFLSAEWAFSDPYAERGTVIRYFCFAGGLYKIGIFGILLLFILQGFFFIDRGRLVPINFAQFTVAICFVFFGLIIGFICSSKASITASNHKIRPWLDKEFNLARRFRKFPPVYIGKANYVPRILEFSILLSLCLIVGITTGLYHATIHLIEVIQNNRPDIEIKRSVATLVIPSCFYLAIIWVFIKQCRTYQLTARIPEDCWGDYGDYQ